MQCEKNKNGTIIVLESTKKVDRSIGTVEMNLEMLLIPKLK